MMQLHAETKQTQPTLVRLANGKWDVVYRTRQPGWNNIRQIPAPPVAETLKKVAALPVIRCREVQGPLQIKGRALTQYEARNIERRVYRVLPSLFDIAEEVFDVTRAQIKSQQRAYRIARARFPLYRFLTVELGWSLPKTGNAIGGRDHTTVIHGCAVIGDRMAKDPVYAGLVAEFDRRARELVEGAE